LAGILLCSVQASAQTQFRSLSGTVTDAQHEPLRGAVVEVENLGDQDVQSFLTDKSGHYNFKRLDGNTDYSFWATYRSHRSRSRTISKFNSKTGMVVNLAIKLD
jgi:hypothetical protein